MSFFSEEVFVSEFLINMIIFMGPFFLLSSFSLEPILYSNLYGLAEMDQVDRIKFIKSVIGSEKEVSDYFFQDCYFNDK